MIVDKFQDVARLGHTENIPFKLSPDREPRPDIPKWRLNRTGARSIGKPTYLHTKPCTCCGSLIRRVYNNECFDCFKVSKKK